jgi:tetratricopeptide (TPR) repeat protein
MGRIVFFEPDAGGQPSTACAAYQAAFPAFEGLIDSASVANQIREIAKSSSVEAVVFNWDQSQWPYLHLEEYWQDPALSAIPIVILCESIKPADRAFLAEYGCDSVVVHDGDSKEGAKLLREALIRENNEKLPASRVKSKARRFFHMLHAGNFTEAEQYLDGHADSFCTAAEREFYLALVYKTQKEFERAVEHLSKGIKGSKGQETLAAKFLHLIGNIALKRRSYEQAVKFLDAANKVSPLNLRRRFLLGQCYLEMNELGKALVEYFHIYKICPVYPGIHVRMAEMIYGRADSPEAMQKIGPLLPYIPDRELVNLYRRMLDTNQTTYIRQFLDLVIREFSLRANRCIDDGDFYAALKPYKHIERIIDASDEDRQMLLSYCYARVYFRASDFDAASEHLTRAMSLAKSPVKKHLDLKEMIDKARDAASKTPA